MYIIHSAVKEEFDKEIKTGFYGKSSVEKFGYVHCSDLDTYALVAPNFKDDFRERVVLVIDVSKVLADVKWEDGGGLDFPHVYGLISVDSIIGVYPHLWSDERVWIPNEELSQYVSDKNNIKL